MKKVLAGALVALAFGVAPAAAQACPIAGGGITTNRAGDVARFWALRPLQGMNCPSAQYVMNKWLRRAFRRSYSRKLPRRFYDGYVTWYCRKTSHSGWRCNEYDSGTAFRFRALVIN